MSKNTILVPLDGSELAEQAIAVADRLLQGREGGKLIFMRALETPQHTAWLPAELLSLCSREEEMVARYLESKEKAWSDRGYQVETYLAPGPGPVQAVVELTQARANLVVMSSHGQSGWVEYVLGSNTEKVLRLCPVPLLVVRSELSKTDEQFNFQKIVVPLDGSKRAEAALPQALDIAAGGDATVTLVGVSVVFEGHAFEGDMRTVVQPDLNRIEKYLNEQAEWLRNQGLSVDTVVTRGNAADEILKPTSGTAEELIVMTTQGRTGLAHWLYGSVAERVIRKSECSVLVLKGGQES